MLRSTGIRTNVAALQLVKYAKGRVRSLSHSRRCRSGFDEDGEGAPPPGGRRSKTPPLPCMEEIPPPALGLCVVPGPKLAPSDPPSPRELPAEKKSRFGELLWLCSGMMIGVAGTLLYVGMGAQPAAKEAEVEREPELRPVPQSASPPPPASTTKVCSKVRPVGAVVEAELRAESWRHRASTTQRRPPADSQPTTPRKMVEPVKMVEPAKVNEEVPDVELDPPPSLHPVFSEGSDEFFSHHNGSGFFEISIASPRPSSPASEYVLVESMEQ